MGEWASPFTHKERQDCAPGMTSKLYVHTPKQLHGTVRGHEHVLYMWMLVHKTRIYTMLVTLDGTHECMAVQHRRE